MSDTTKYNVLFVDDEQRILTSLRSIFRREYNVFTALGGKEALEILANNTINVIVSDQRMPNMLGNELLAQVHKLYPQTMRLLLTGFMDKQAIIQTINEGEIYRFINKPWSNESIQAVIKEAAEASQIDIGFSPQQAPTPANQNSATIEGAGDQAKAPLPQPQKKAISDHATLIMGSSQSLRNQIRQVCKQEAIAVYSTQSIRQAVNAIVARPSIGVLVIELLSDTDEVIHTISLLKQKRPELITVVLADETDAEVAVSLINSGQVFRYLSKPLELLQLQKIIKAGFERHSAIKNNINSQVRFKVQKPTNKITAGLKELFTSFGLLKKQT